MAAGTCKNVEHVFDLEGGFDAWVEEGLPWDDPEYDDSYEPLDDLLDTRGRMQPSMGDSTHSSAVP